MTAIAVAETLSIAPGGIIEGRMRVPGDKSISHRSVMFSALADGICKVTGCLLGEDVRATMAAFRAMGVAIDAASDGSLTIAGVGVDGLHSPSDPLDLGNSGTSMRLLSGIIAGARLQAVLTGDTSLTRRPMRRVTDPLGIMGARIDTSDDGRPPLTIHHGPRLTAIDYAMPVASAQVKSAVLLAGLFAQGTTTVTESAVTRDHTERLLRAFGVNVNVEGSRIAISGGQRLQPCEIAVPSDISSAAFFMVGAALCPGAKLLIERVGVNPTRTGVIDILRLMGADITLSNEQLIGAEPIADITVCGGTLRGIDIPEHLVPLAIDEFPALFIAAAGAEGTTRLTGAEELRVKESDRISVMAEGLNTLGVSATPLPDGIKIIGQKRLGGGRIDSHGDHRIAMAFALSALRSESPIHLTGCGTIATSFPQFPDLARKAGLRIE